MKILSKLITVVLATSALSSIVMADTSACSKQFTRLKAVKYPKVLQTVSSRHGFCFGNASGTITSISNSEIDITIQHGNYWNALCPAETDTYKITNCQQTEDQKVFPYKKAFSLSGTVTTGGSNFIGRVTVSIDTNDPDNYLKINNGTYNLSVWGKIYPILGFYTYPG